MAKKAHIFHEAGDDLASWIDTTATDLADGFYDGTKAPFSADVPEREKLDYYEDRLFLPDGTPNQEGRSAEMARIGVEGYARVMQALSKRRQPQMTSVPLPQSQEVPGGY